MLQGIYCLSLKHIWVTINYAPKTIADDPENDYYDYLWITFVWIATSTVCRSGDLAPTPSKPGALTSIVTLDWLNIDDELLKNINLSGRDKCLL